MEARDGATAFHLHISSPKLVTRKTPIAEAWMKVKAAQKMKKLIYLGGMRRRPKEEPFGLPYRLWSC
jgi:hypothetical protein